MYLSTKGMKVLSIKSVANSLSELVRGFYIVEFFFESFLRKISIVGLRIDRMEDRSLILLCCCIIL